MTTAERIAQYSRGSLVFDVVDTGPIEGSPVVLLHGFPQRASSWSKVAPILHGEGLRTFAPDQRGYSPGARPKKRFDYAVAELERDVTALIDEIGSPVHLVGHDWGATVAWVVASRHPSKVRTLTVFSVGHPSAYLRALAGEQFMRSYYLHFFQLPRWPEWTLSSGRGWGGRFLSNMGFVGDLADSFQREIVQYGALTGGLNWYRALPKSIGERRGRIAVPTTMVWSTNDPALGRKQAADSERYVDAAFKLVELTGMDHWIPENDAESAANAIISRVLST